MNDVVAMQIVDGLKHLSHYILCSFFTVDLLRWCRVGRQKIFGCGEAQKFIVGNLELTHDTINHG